ncbi:TauD/TfdA dioxygenase family protein [Falsiroseomonas sp.]|uniref:TauD/TfdA dioxygenase family protein n=1 Tax=Falsiroseomonas sp. TaxID=2870721 RepID=UPI003F707170
MLSIRPMQPFGAEVLGAPASLELSDADFVAVEQAWGRHSILAFRGITATPAQQIAFTRRLGPLHIMQPPQYNLDGHPEIFVVGNATEDGKAVGMRDAGMGFHSDGEDKAVPNAGSFLQAIQVPPERGDTLFADMVAAWDALEEPLRAKLRGRRARFSRAALHHVHYPHLPPLTDQQRRDRPDVWHPIARRHPTSGRVALYIGRWAVEIEGMAAEEGTALIARLVAHAQDPSRIYRHLWRAGDAVLWDNRVTQHCATPFDSTRYTRRMHRTTLEGEVPLLA